MTETLTAAEFKALINDSVITATNAEYVINHGINRLNIHGAGISNMTGDAGSKTWSGTSAQKGAVVEAARLTYHSFYKGIEPVSVGAFSISNADLLANQVYQNMIKEIARQLTGLDSPPIYVSNDPVETS